MAKQKFVCLYLDYLENWSHYSDAQVGKIVRAMLAYALTGEAPNLKGQERYIWPSVKSQMDRDSEKYTSKCKSNQENGKKGGRPKKQEKPTKSDGFSEEPNQANKKENENENENKNENERGIAHNAHVDGTLFTRFWEAYPNKLGREKAWEAWKKLNPDHTMAEILISALECWKRSERWRNKAGDLQFAPRAEAFLSDEGYWKHPPGAEGIPKGASGQLGAAELEAIQRVLQNGPRRQLDEDEQAAIRRMMEEDA